ncbi:MAG: S-layer homology domain-containing protein [Oscillospiraceae bacterium]|nr:S-layer homology domain-containing protein [Oscillospiraceae bacterium]
MALAVLLLSLAIRAAAADPMVPLSYLTQTFLPELRATLSEAINAKINAFRLKYGLTVGDSGEDDIFGGYTTVKTLTSAELAAGGTLELSELTTLYLVSGDANAHISGELLDLSGGAAHTGDVILEQGHRYLTAEGSSVTLRAYSPTVQTMAEGSYRLTYSGTHSAEQTFIDVPESHWANSYVTYAYTNGIVNGVSEYRFSPSGTVTRAMFVTMLGRLSGVRQEDYYWRVYSDVAVSEWYGAYVTWAKELGIVTGYEDGTFRPEDKISREQMAVVLHRFGAYGGDSMFEPAAASFTDSASISEWAADAVNWAADSGLITGYTDGSFGPQKSASRAEVCAILYRLRDTHSAEAEADTDPDFDVDSELDSDGVPLF